MTTVTTGAGVGAGAVPGTAGTAAGIMDGTVAGVLAGVDGTIPGIARGTALTAHIIPGTTILGIIPGTMADGTIPGTALITADTMATTAIIIIQDTTRITTTIEELRVPRSRAAIILAREAWAAPDVPA